MKNTVSILGCGWLGQALGQELSQKGYRVIGSCRNPQQLLRLAECGIEGTLFEIKPGRALERQAPIFQSQTLVVCLPPTIQEGSTAFFKAQIQLLAQTLSHTPIKAVLFVSSISVYPPLDKPISETDAKNPPTLAGEALLMAEQILQSASAFQTTVVRFGGLVGYDRHPFRAIQKRTKRQPDQPLNIIHQDDASQILTRIIEKNVWCETFNACAPLHPLRKQYYAKAFKLKHLPVPQFPGRSTRKAIKVISSRKVMEQLQFTFKYPNPLQMLEIPEAWSQTKIMVQL